MKYFSSFVIAVLFSICAVSQTLPDFSFTTAKKEKVTPATLPQNKPIVVCYFDPFCEKCITQAAKFKQSAAKFSGITIVYVSWAEFDDNEAFKKKYFTGMPNVLMCKDENFKFDTWFGYSEVPVIYVYNKARARTASFTTAVSVEEILNACNKTL
jgi:peroxiredoxin